MAELFGFRFTRIKDENKGVRKSLPLLQKTAQLMLLVVVSLVKFLTQRVEKEQKNDLIRRYRDIAQQPECDSAIEDIINESIVSDERDQSVSIVLDQLPYTSGIKKKITEEFNHVLRLLDFDTKGHDIFRRWYIDGRLFYHKVIDKDNQEEVLLIYDISNPEK